MKLWSFIGENSKRIHAERGLFLSLPSACEALRELLYFAGGEEFVSKFMKPIQGYHLINPEDLVWRPSNATQ